MKTELSKPQQTVAAPEAGGELAALTLLASLVVSVEHGWLCIRNDGGWLLWSEKVSNMDNGSIALSEIDDELRKGQAQWLRDQAEMLEANAPSSATAGIGDAERNHMNTPWQELL